MQTMASGATVPHISQSQIESFRLALPSIPEQERICSVLDAVDDLIEHNRRRVEVLEEMARAIYREWFQHFRYSGYEKATLVESPLGKIPEGWSARKVGEVAQVVRGRSYRKDDLVEAGGLPFVNLKCMARGGGFRRVGLKRYNGQYKPEQLVEADDIVLAVTDLTQGREILARATLVPRLPQGRAVISLDVVRLVPLDPQDRLWIFASLRWSDFADRVKEYANGSTVLHLAPTHITEAWTLWPPDHLRLQLSSAIDPLLGQVNDLNDSSNALDAMRGLLLPKLVGGQIEMSSVDLGSLVEDSVA
jgi:type I restriction enzyme S subunit